MRNFFLAAGFIILLPGCIGFPVDLADEEPFSEDSKTKISLNQTKRADIRELFGEPERTFAGEHWWVFSKGRKMTEWLIMAGHMYYFGMDFIGGDIRQYHLLLEFNEDDSVRQVLVVNERHPCDKSGHICYEGGVLEVPHDPSEVLRIAPGYCAVFLYILKSEIPYTAVFIQIDSLDSGIRYMTNTGYVRLILTPGPHSIALGADPISLECKKQETYFVRMTHDEEYKASLVAVPTKRGSKEIVDRKLILRED